MPQLFRCIMFKYRFECERGRKYRYSADAVLKKIVIIT